MMRSARTALLGSLWLTGWSGAGSGEETAAGLTARISGAYDAEIAAPGVLVYLPQGGFERTGYYFLADAQGLRPHGITFVLPPDIGPGRHELKNPTSFELGTVVSVRVDRERGEAVLSADRNTTGFLVLDSFPKGAKKPNGEDVSGSFAFATEFATGERIEAEGEFAFAYR